LNILGTCIEASVPPSQTYDTGIHPVAFHPTGTSGGPHLLAKKITRCKEILKKQRMGEDYLLLVLFVISREL
jgi:hypothetical protein